MKPERKISTGSLARVMYILAVGMVIILTGFLLCTDNVIRYQARQSDGYQILTDLEDSQYEDESAPIGIVQDHSFIYEGDGDTLAFYTVHQYVEVWMEDTLIYSLKPGDGTCIETIGSNWNVLSLTDQDHGKRITIRIMVTIHSQLETITKNTMSLKCFTLRIYRVLSFLLPGSDPLSMHVQSVQNCSLHVYVLSQDNF